LNTLDTNFEDNQSPSRTTSLTALSARYHNETLTAIGSLLATLTNDEVETGTAAEDLKRLSPAASISWRISEHARLRASVKDGFRVPTFNDLYYSKIGNTSLKPEKAFQGNLGATYQTSGTKFSLTVTDDVYYNHVKDKIVATPTMFIWRMRNIGEVQMVGNDLSINAAYSPKEWLKLRARANYSYLYAVDTTDPESKSYMNQIAYTPRHSGAATISAETPWVTVGYSLLGTSARYVLNQNTEANRIAPYMDHGVSISRTLATKYCKIDLSAQALNIGNVNYEIIKYYPMPGRNYRITIKITY